MTTTPKWYMPVSILALLWNLMGCAAYLADVMMTPEDLAAMTEAQQAMYAARPAWAVSATAIAVWGGALGCIGLIMRKRWAGLVLMVSLAGIVVQDLGLFAMGDAAAAVDTTALFLQGLVLLIAIGLVSLARRGTAEGWFA
ncbi:MAG: hypothetical protein HQ485_09470 [Acidobacteria bacterium]|jgi:hypothetical protein|nr:hypothetical protein [Acidobacteriota bacterium]